MFIVKIKTSFNKSARLQFLLLIVLLNVESLSAIDRCFRTHGTNLGSFVEIINCLKTNDTSSILILKDVNTVGEGVVMNAVMSPPGNGEWSVMQ
jgi:hypothetical protein